MRIKLFALLTLFSTILAGCAADQTASSLPRAETANALPMPAQATGEYRIGPLDTIAVSVFQEPDLTAKDIPVDANGHVLLPLIGSVTASGKTTDELAKEIASRLSQKYLQNPQVTVLVQSSASQRVTVDGSVTEPGVYEIKGHTTLLDALAMAKGPTRIARTNEVVVFRVVDGKRMGARFDLDRIRRGEMEDPTIIGRDTVVVGLSNVKAGWRDFLQSGSLLFSIFRVF